MTKKHSEFGPISRKQRSSALPSAIAGILVWIFIAINGIGIWHQEKTDLVFLLGVGAIGTIFLIAFNFFIIPAFSFEPALGWIYAGVAGMGMGLLTYVLPEQSDIYLGILWITLAITCALISGRRTSYFLLFLTVLLTIIIRHDYSTNVSNSALHFSLAVIAAITVETILQLKKTSYDQIHRLEIITDFSREIASTLQTKQVMALLNAAFQNSIEADTYFVGVREGDEMRFELLYDDGEFFENQRAKLEGTLSRWVLDNQHSLFLPDLRKEVSLRGVRLVLVGRHKTNLSWMGVPMRSQGIDGIIAVGSYRPNTFDRADLELLTALAQHAAQAIDNTFRHAQVELQSKLDSLTNVYNHGQFLKLLESHINQAKQEHHPVSVIMLDIDHFKQYNDAYGHLAGDEILRNLCNVIKAHLKRTDAVGRWGGEEFVISLPNANGAQTQQVAERIRASMLTLSVHNYEQTTIPVPTVSQGIAVYPLEAGEMMKLIDLADKRLYLAKERGRNQVEPDESHWKKLYEHNNQ